MLSACKSGWAACDLARACTDCDAFFLAGAQSMVASLWSVDDAATRALMVSSIVTFFLGSPAERRCIWR